MSVKNVIGSIEKKFGKEAVASSVPKDIKKFSSTSYKIDDSIGGGYPKGRIIELFGWEASGKTTLATLAAISIQREGKAVGYVDMEQAFDLQYAQKLGLDISPEKFVLCQPDYGEQAIEIMREMLKSKEIGLIIGDSVSAFLPKAVIDGEAGESKMGLHARMMSSMIPVLGQAIKNGDCAIIFINQFREKIGQMFGDSKTTSGGNALKFYASMRLEVIRMGNIKDGDTVIGIKIKIKAKKNKVAMPYTETETNLLFGVGLDTMGELLEMAIEQDIIKKAGSWYSYKGTKLGQGELLVKTIMKDNPEMVEEIKNKIFKTK